MKELLKAEAIGERATSVFIKLRLNSSDLDLFDPLKKLKLTTFTLTAKPKTKRTKETTKTDLDFFARYLVIVQNRQLDLRKVFKYELGQVPPSFE